MIDLHLLTKIAENDAEFRKSIVERIREKANIFINDFAVSLKKGNYNSCYYKALNFYQCVMPYCRVSFLNDIQKSLNILSHSDDQEVKKAICKSMLREIAAGVRKPVVQNNDSTINAALGLAS